MKWKREWITSTAYVVNPAEVGKSYNGIRCIVNGQETSTGTKPEVGTAAVDTKVFPYGTRFYFKGYGFAEARDTGVIGNVVDLVLPTCKKAILWGRRRRLAWVLLPHIR
jgi:3D (Asp-Asp-Asp) domain-containing protein